MKRKATKLSLSRETLRQIPDKQLLKAAGGTGNAGGGPTVTEASCADTCGDTCGGTCDSCQGTCGDTCAGSCVSCATNCGCWP